MPRPDSSSRIRVLVSCLLLTLSACSASAQYWSRAFGPMGLDGPTGYDGEAYCLSEWNGNLVVGGWFTEAGGEPSADVALWNGTWWEGMDGGINAIPEFVLGVETGVVVGGPFWQAGGQSISRCALWTGLDWNAMSGLQETPLCAAIHNGGLWVGGSFATESGYPAWVGVKHWTGTVWTDPDNFGEWNLYEDEARVLAHFNTNLHVGGTITRDLGLVDTYNHVAWNETDGPTHFGEGLTLGHAECMEPAATGLWIGGTFQYADGQESRGLVYMASGGTYFPVADAATPRYVWGLTSFEGVLHTAQREWTPTERWVVRRYGVGIWSEPLGGAFTDGLNCLGTRNPLELYVGGFFANGIVRWDDGEWVHLGGGIGRTTHDRHWIRALTEFEGDIIAAGYNMRLPSVLEGQSDCMNVVRWDGDAWHRMNNGLGNEVTSLAVYDEELYAGMDPGVGLERIQRWDGAAWQPAGDANNQVNCLAVHGGELIAGGNFTTVDGVAVGRVAAFDGLDWHALGVGMNAGVRALYSDHGSLYAAGNFTTADGQPAARVARWNGSTWEALGAGFDDGYAYALTVYDGALHAGGSFTASDGAALGHVARWDGAGWTEEGGGVSDPYYARATVSALLVEDGDLWVGGHFTRAGGVPSCCIGRRVVGTQVPTLLTTLEATPSTDGTVRITWRVAPALAEASFRLTAATASSSWTVPWSVVDGGFVARDASPALGGASSVRYALEYSLDGVAWNACGETTAALSPPAAAALVAAAPNPFNPATVVTYVIDRPQAASLQVYDLAGRRLAVVASGRHEAGRHSAVWDGRADDGRELPSGTYVMRLVTTTTSRSIKVMLVR